jgi:sporulation integral membrane protein YlbJ
MMDSARTALALCARTILPSLFPFFVLSGLLSRLGFQRLFRRAGSGLSALLVGLTGGYPMGAAYVGELYRRGALERRAAERMLLYANNTGPAFLLGAVGTSVFHSPRLGFFLWAVHAAAALLLYFCFGVRGAGAEPTDIPPEPFGAAFPAAVRQGVSAALAVCGFVVCFTVLVGLLDSHGLFSLTANRLSSFTALAPQAARALLTGILELGSAIGAMEGLPPGRGTLALAAAVLGWGGLSVHCQTAAVLAETDLRLRLHTLGRVLAAALGAALAWSFSPLVGIV